MSEPYFHKFWAILLNICPNFETFASQNCIKSTWKQVDGAYLADSSIDTRLNSNFVSIISRDKSIPEFCQWNMKNIQYFCQPEFFQWNIKKYSTYFCQLFIEINPYQNFVNDKLKAMQCFCQPFFTIKPYQNFVNDTFNWPFFSGSTRSETDLTTCPMIFMASRVL